MNEYFHGASFWWELMFAEYMKTSIWFNVENVRDMVIIKMIVRTRIEYAVNVVAVIYGGNVMTKISRTVLTVQAQ